MSIANVLSALGDEIERLQQVRSLLAVTTSLNAAKPATNTRKHNMSAEARKRIGDAQRKRWAKQKNGK